MSINDTVKEWLEAEAENELLRGCLGHIACDWSGLGTCPKCQMEHGAVFPKSGEDMLREYARFILSKIPIRHSSALAGNLEGEAMTTEPKIEGPYKANAMWRGVIEGPNGHEVDAMPYESAEHAENTVTHNLANHLNKAYFAGFDAGARQAIDQQKGGDNHVDS